MSIRIRKEGRYLKFTKDGDEFQFDIVTGQAYSHHGNPVKTLARYFRGMGLYSTIDSFEDDNYKNWFRYICRQNQRMSNMGSILREFKHYTHLENFFCSGFNGVYVPDEALDPKLIRVLHKFDLNWTEYRDMLFKCVGVDGFVQIVDRGHLARFSRHDSARCIQNLLNEGYQLGDLIKYIEYLEFVEGIVTPHLLSDLADYWREACLVSRNPSRYPKNFLTVKRSTSYRYSMDRDTYDEGAFKKIADSQSEGLYYRKGQYEVTYPRVAEDIRKEGSDLNHCVASYVTKVTNAQCHIVFMRNIDRPDESFITVQLSLAHNVIQSRGEGNRSLTEDETAFLEGYQTWASNPNRKFHRPRVTELAVA